MKDVLNYSNVFYISRSEAVHREISVHQEHRLLYVYSGTAMVNSNGYEVALAKGDCVFIPRNMSVLLTCSPKKEESFSMNMMLFSPSSLLHAYPKIELKFLFLEMDDNISNLITLPARPDITSLFQSFTPYFKTTFHPSEEIIRLKVLEGIYLLMNIDKRFFTCLYDFTELWKVNLYQVFNLL